MMAAGTRHVDSSLRAKTNPYLKQAQKMGNSLKPASTQRTNSDLMVVLQRTIRLRVVAKQ